MRIALALALLALLTAPALLPAQIISGTLMEADTRALLAGGSVTLLDGDSVTVANFRTDSAGAFHFTIPRGGSYRLVAQQAGFRPAISPRLVIGARDTLEVEFSLARDVVVLEPLVVTARTRRLTPAAERFYQRARNSIMGDFITRAEIDRLHPLRTTELLNRLPGVSLFPVLGGNSVTIRGSCRPSVYVDGVRVGGYRTIDDLVQPLELEGVEVYRSASSAPVEYTGMGAGCAAILLWTRIE
jgi:outer membrane receptor protein involved in Fe transport